MLNHVEVKPHALFMITGSEKIRLGQNESFRMIKNVKWPKGFQGRVSQNELTKKI